MNRFTFNLGLRAEQWKHFATTGANIFTFDWEVAPRLSAIYDVLGDGRQKAFAYWGRYYDPIRNNMTNFAGTLTGSVLEEQVFLNGDWVTFRTAAGRRSRTRSSRRRRRRPTRMTSTWATRSISAGA
jgi:hypothetical protein